MDSSQLVGSNDHNSILQFHDKQANLWTALPGIIQTFDAAKMTCTVQPSIQAKLFNLNGTVSDATLPLLVDCPIQFPSGGGCSITFPIRLGDECLIIFASRCIDNWWQLGGIQSQAELRMHDLSDGFILLGFRSVPRVLSGISTSTVQIRSDDGVAFISLHPTSHAVTITAPTTTINGNVQVNGTLTASVDVIGNGTSLHTHHHGGVTTGSGNTGVPI